MRTETEIKKRIEEIKEEKEILQDDFLRSKYETERSIIAERNVQKSLMINQLKWVLNKRD